MNACERKSVLVNPLACEANAPMGIWPIYPLLISPLKIVSCTHFAKTILDDETTWTWTVRKVL